MLGWQEGRKTPLYVIFHLLGQRAFNVLYSIIIRHQRGDLEHVY